MKNRTWRGVCPIILSFSSARAREIKKVVNPISREDKKIDQVKNNTRICMRMCMYIYNYIFIYIDIYLSLCVCMHPWSRIRNTFVCWSLFTTEELMRHKDHVFRTRSSWQIRFWSPLGTPPPWWIWTPPDLGSTMRCWICADVGFVV